jgi:NADH dehydrogenase [ubiquinone] 1 alpha subcomplex assembly factor 6
MRMQWWRDALQQIYPEDDTATHYHQQPSVEGFLNIHHGSCWHNPVVRALFSAVQEKDLTRRFLERLLDAREADLEIQQMATMDDILAYSEDTCSSLLYLALETVHVSMHRIGLGGVGRLCPLLPYLHWRRCLVY